MNDTASVFRPLSILGLILILLPATVSAQELELQHHHQRYHNFLQQGQLEKALSHLKWILEHEPTYPRGNDDNFQSAVVLYGRLLDQTQDSTLRKVYFQEAVGVFDQAESVLAASERDVDVFSWVLNKGRFMQRYYAEFPESRSAVIESYRRAYDLAPARLHDYYLQVVMVAYAEDDKELAREFMRRVEASYPERDSLQRFIELLRLEM